VFKDVVCGLGRCEGLAAFVPGLDERVDGVDEVGDGVEAVPSDGLAADDGEEHLD
jgi:hypothetical protein